MFSFVRELNKVNKQTTPQKKKMEKIQPPKTEVNNLPLLKGKL